MHIVVLKLDDLKRSHRAIPGNESPEVPQGDKRYNDLANGTINIVQSAKFSLIIYYTVITYLFRGV